MKRFDSSSLHSASTARTYPVGEQELRTAFEEAVKGLPRWSLTSSSEKEIRAVRHSRVFGFEDDVTIRLAPTSPGGIHQNTRAELESASRIGAWDLGQNRRNLRELLVALDQELTS